MGRKSKPGVDRVAKAGWELVPPDPRSQSCAGPHGPTEGEKDERSDEKKRLAWAQTIPFHPPLSRRDGQFSRRFIQGDAVGELIRRERST